MGGFFPVAKDWGNLEPFLLLNLTPWISRYDVDFHQEPMRFDHAALESWKRTRTIEGKGAFFY